MIVHFVPIEGESSYEYNWRIYLVLSLMRFVEGYLNRSVVCDSYRQMLERSEGGAKATPLGMIIGQILDFSFSSPFIIFIFILISIKFRFFILIPTSIRGLGTHILPKYPIQIYEMNCFKKS